MHIHSPQVIAYARKIGCTELQALELLKVRDYALTYGRNPAMLLQVPAH